MEKWRGKVAVVTGASAGIGVALVKALCKHGINVIGLARRAERVEVSWCIATQKKRWRVLECEKNFSYSMANRFRKFRTRSMKFFSTAISHYSPIPSNRSSRTSWKVLRAIFIPSSAMFQTRARWSVHSSGLQKSSEESIFSSTMLEFSSWLNAMFGRWQSLEDWFVWSSLFPQIRWLARRGRWSNRWT